MAYRSILFAGLLAAIAAAVITGSLAERGPAPVERRPPRVIADVSTERLLPSGPIVGFTDDRGVHAWLGIPYAAAPSGELRWRAPADPAPWVQTFDAFDPGPACAQASRLPGESDQTGPAVLGREDCLTLSVWAPADEAADPTAMAPADAAGAKSLRPVMVWIDSGSAYVHAGNPIDGSALAAREGVVVVSIRYRLGALGFFRHPALVDPAPEPGARGRVGGGPSAIAEARGVPARAPSGNFGTLDLVKGLQWVRDNAALFGGDPGNVTIFGESEGANQVMALLLAPPAAGLFHRAIVQGGSLDFPDELASDGPAVGLAEGPGDVIEPGPTEAGRAADESPARVDPIAFADAFVVELLQIDGTMASEADARRFAAGLDAAETADYLRSRSVRDVLAVTETLARRDPGRGRPGPVRDGVVLPLEPPLERFGSPDRYNAVPIILGSNRDDAKLELAQNPELVRSVLDRFHQARDPERYDEVARLASALQRANGVDEPAGVLRTSQGPSVWVYRFDWDEHPIAFGTNLQSLLGAGHGLEVPFVFGQFRTGPSSFGELAFDEASGPSRSRLSSEMMSYWAQFAWQGAPGRGRRGELPEWRPWDEAGRVPGRFLVFDSVAGGGVRMARGKVTSDEVLAEVVASTDLAAEEKCLVLRRLRPRHWDGLDPLTREALDVRSRLCGEGQPHTL